VEIVLHIKEGDINSGAFYARLQLYGECSEFVDEEKDADPDYKTFTIPAYLNQGTYRIRIRQDSGSSYYELIVETQ
jgi:hypothetical protein